MKVTVIEKLEIEHCFEVDEHWPVECRQDQQAANTHIETAIREIGLDSISNAEQSINRHDILINGKAVA